MKSFRILLFSFLFFISASELLAQRVVVKERRGRHGRRTVVVTRSRYRPAKVVVYHPYWRPAYGYHRRWVYFPRYNVYWDNWRSHYVFLNGNVWVSQAAAPPVIVNVNLDREKNIELREEEDDVDDIYKSNDSHKSAGSGD